MNQVYVKITTVLRLNESMSIDIDDSNFEDEHIVVTEIIALTRVAIMMMIISRAIHMT